MENNSNYLVGFGVSPEECSSNFMGGDYYKLDALFFKLREAFESIEQDLRSYAQTGENSFYMDILVQLHNLNDPQSQTRQELSEVERRRNYKVNKEAMEREAGWDISSR